MNTERDELAQMIADSRNTAYGFGEGQSPALTDYRDTDALLADGYRRPRTITARQELDTLAVDSVALDGNGRIVHRIDDETMDGRPLWQTCLGIVTGGLVILPATVLHDGGVA